MEITPLSPFNSMNEPERLVQTVGCLLAADKYYAVVRPNGASPFDGEDRLLIRDNLFGDGFQQVGLDFEWPVAMIGGAALADPVDALMLTSGGFLLMIRSGQMRIEKIPNVGGTGENPSEYGDTAAMAVVDGKLWVVGNWGRIFVRDGDSQWRELDSIKHESSVFLNCICEDGWGGVVIGGYQNNQTIVGRITSSGSYQLDQPASGKIQYSSRNVDGEIWLCGTDQILLRGTAESGFVSIETGQLSAGFSPVPNAPKTSFSATAHFGRQTFISGPGGSLWTLQNGSMTFIQPITTEPKFLFRSFEVTDVGLVAHGGNGFAIFDGDNWMRVPLP